MDERLLDGQRLSISIQTSDPISEEDAAAFGALREHRLPSSSSNTLEIEPCPEPVHIASRPRMPAPNDAESDTPSCERITIFAMAGAIAVLLVACVVLGAGTGERLESEEPSGQGQATEAILILASAHGSEDKPASARAVLRAAEIAQANDLQHLAASALFLTTNRLALSPYWPLDVAGTPGQVAVSAAAVHPSGLLLALGGSNGSVEVVPVAPASGHLLPDADAPRSVLACAGGVATLSWSRGGRYLAAACTAADTEARSEVMVWEVSGSGASWEGIGLQAAAFANSDDGTMPHRGLRELHALWAGSPVVALAWGVEDRLHGNRTASLAVGCADGALQVWSGIGGVPVVAANTSAEGLQALSWSRDGELLAVGRAGRTLQMWNVSALLNGLTSMPVAAEGGPESIGVTALRFSPVGRWLASGSEDGRVLVWDISRFWLGRLPAAGRKPPVLSPAQTLPAHSMPVSGVSWASETELTTVSTKDRVRVYKLRGDQFQLAHLLGNAYSGFSSVDFSGRMPHVLAAGTASQKASAWVAAVQLGKRGPERFRLSCEANIATMFGAPFSYLAATVSESGERLAISSQEGHVCVWERNRTLFGSGIGPWRTAALLEASDGGHPAGCMQLAFSPDGRALAAAADGGTVFVWRRTASRSWAGQAQPAAPRGPAAKLAWSPDGALLAAATERGAWLWPAALPNAPPAVFVNASHGAATAVKWSNGIAAGTHVLATAHEHGPVRVWSVAWNSSGHPEVRPAAVIVGSPPASELAVSTVGRLAVSSLGGTVKVYDVRHPEAPEIVATLTAESEQVLGLLWSPDGSQLAAQLGGGSIQVWEGLGSAPASWRVQQDCDALSWTPGRLACGRLAHLGSGDLDLEYLVVGFDDLVGLLRRLTYGDLSADDLQLLGMGGAPGISLEPSANYTG